MQDYFCAVKFFVSTLFFPFILFTAGAQEIIITDSLCSAPVQIIVMKTQYAADGFYFINVHEDETTGIEAAKEFVQDSGGVFIYLKHGQTRNINFNCDGNKYAFDPNRIYSDSGRMSSLKKLSASYNPYTDSITANFANSFLSLINNPKHIIALHNNTDENYSVKSYLKGGSEYGNAQKIYINKKLDTDDFIFTTDENIFRECKKLKLNVALQDNEDCFDDGSLSVYFGRENISYTNIEAQHTHLQQQKEMINAVWKIIKENTVQ